MTDTIDFDPFAIAATLSAQNEAKEQPGATAESVLLDTLRAYFTMARVRGMVHELPVIHGDVPGYGPLARILSLAYDQSAKGKGKERHANARPFEKQPIMEIGRMLGSTCDGEMYQVIKKVQEASNMVARGNTEGAKAELLGAIVYSAAAYLLIEESERQ